ncbi:non-ribosomal peptide synthetase [Streptomyces fradiae]|uniref:non-ribosomal peptide synthetase n=1 Tax=Streptomyces fradiae TaxID=1906 RepID=UPI002943A474|nr:amino acid adenylation domain-containing protein [Streptomyces fradiae]WOI61889.1 amino acid adenylation domain-containing protein [Streptomyces fradiae]
MPPDHTHRTSTPARPARLSAPARPSAADAEGRDRPRDTTLSALFEAQARKTPDAPALTWHGGHWSYAELRLRARRAAHRLRERGVREGEAVALLLPRSPEAVAAVLGVLHAGAVFLPVDPSHPAARVRHVLEDASVRHVVAAEDVPDALLHGRQRHTPADLAHEWLPAPDNARRGAAGDPAYIIYTSGSTGRPKGVVCTHRGLLRVAVDTPDLRPGPGERVLATTNPTFDVSCWELFGTLLNGACLHLADIGTLLSTDALAELMEERRITTMWLSAGLFHQHARARPGMFAPLRRLVAGGDALNPSAVRAVLRHGCPERFLNGYGPTENTVFSTVHRIERLAADAVSVPIGRPVAGTVAHVVGPDGAPAAPGERGELWLGGDGVAAGYLGDAEKTARNFVPDRFAGAGGPAGGRLYRTGDVVSLREDGVLEFHGRRDRQVKLRGYRVELDEVETALTEHPEVTGAAVGVIGEGAGRRLAAVVTADTPAERAERASQGEQGGEQGEQAGQAGRAEEAQRAGRAEAGALPDRIRAYARDTLPAHMVPARVAVAGELPLTSSGKTDRRRLMHLLERQDGRRAGRDSGRAPADRDERRTAAVWRRALDVDEVPADADFFALGGTSLRATQVAAAVRRLFGLPPERGRELVRALLDDPTLESFTRRVREMGAEGHTAGPGAEPAVDFAREAAPPDLPLLGTSAAGGHRAPRTVFLTGATGFLGVHLIDQLVRRGVRRVHCLVRAGGEEEAMSRLASRMRRHGVDPAALAGRVTALPGDLARPRLGLGEEAWDRLAAEADHIVHAGAHVNFAYPYAALAPANVGGTRAVLELAAHVRVKPVHHVSTIGVLAGSGTAGEHRVTEKTPPAHPERLSMGYPETKWVAERMVAAAGERGLPTTIHRPHEITGTSDRGVWNTDTMMCALLRTLAETGTAPGIELPLDFVPVDHVAAVIGHVVTREEPDGRVLHLTNPRPARLSSAVERLRHRGYPVRSVSYEDWVAAVDALAAEDPGHPMAPYLPMLVETARGSDLPVLRTYEADTFPAVDRTHAEQAAAAGSLTCPPVDAALLDLYLGRLAEIGYLPPPPD